MSALYEGCWHKLGRAKFHVDELQDRVTRWRDLHGDEPYVWGKKFDAKRNRFTFYVQSVAELPVEWSLIAGDALTNLRASLDYMAYDLVGRGTTPHRRPKAKPQFPIIRKKAALKGYINGRMPGISPKQWTIIESYQPYKWGGARNRHPFAALDTLVNWDKHRELKPAVVYNIPSLGFRAGVVGTPRDFAIHRVEWGRVFGKRGNVPAFKPGTQIAHVFGERTGPDPDVEMHFQGAVAIVFQNPRVVFPGALEGIGKFITKLFFEIEPTL